MSPEIQEWSHKSRPGINNLYLLTRHIHRLELLIVITFIHHQHGSSKRHRYCMDTGQEQLPCSILMILHLITEY